MKIAVLLGGASMERDVSVASGSQVVDALRCAGHEVIAVESSRGVLSPAEEHELLRAGIDRVPPDKLGDTDAKLPALSVIPQAAEVDLVFLALHGGSGEDGTIQGLLDMAGLRYTGSGAVGSALAMDKNVAKRLFLGADVPTP